jgi:hypothetical protein
MLSKNNKSKTILATLVLIILSLNVASLITISAPNYASAQVSDQNATTTGGDAGTTEINASSTTSAGENQSIPEVRNTLEGVGGAGGEQNNMTTPQNEITDGNTTQGGTIGSGGAGGAGTAGGIMTGNETTTEGGTIGSGGAGGAGTAGGIMTGEDTRTHNSTS